MTARVFGPAAVLLAAGGNAGQADADQGQGAKDTGLPEVPEVAFMIFSLSGLTTA
jgi:hypothetical protein